MRQAGNRSIRRGHRLCLQCRVDLAGRSNASRTCPRCGFPVMDAMYRVYWSREPGMMTLEAVLKATSMILCVLLAAFLVPRAGLPAFRWGSILACVLLAMGLWMTLSKLTKHVSSFSARWFWAVVFAGSALWALPVPTLAAGLFAGAGLCVWGGHAFDAWKRERMGYAGASHR